MILDSLYKYKKLCSDCSKPYLSILTIWTWARLSFCLRWLTSFSLLNFHIRTLSLSSFICLINFTFAVQIFVQGQIIPRISPLRITFRAGRGRKMSTYYCFSFLKTVNSDEFLHCLYSIKFRKRQQKIIIFNKEKKVSCIFILDQEKIKGTQKICVRETKKILKGLQPNFM